MQFGESMITCAWVCDRIEDYADGADGGLAPQERAMIARHAARCASCRDEIGAANALLHELRALPRFEAPAAAIAAAQAAIDATTTHARRPAPRRLVASVRWIPAIAAAAAVVALAAGARWSGPVRTERAGLAEARVERAARETVFALSYVNHYARMTGEIVTSDVLEKRLVGTMGRAVDRDVSPSLRRAMKKSGIIETEPTDERS